MGIPYRMIQGRRQRAFLFSYPCGKPLLLPAAAEFLLAALVFQDGDLSVYPCRETTVPLQGNNCTLVGKQLYPCRETLVPLQGNTDTLAQRNFKSACRNGHSVRGDGGAALGNSGTADRNNATWSRTIEKCDWDERFNARFLKLSQIDTFNLFLCAQIIHPQT